jgi:hypothetical protein
MDTDGEPFVPFASTPEGYGSLLRAVLGIVVQQPIGHYTYPAVFTAAQDLRAQLDACLDRVTEEIAHELADEVEDVDARPEGEQPAPQPAGDGQHVTVGQLATSDLPAGAIGVRWPDFDQCDYHAIALVERTEAYYGTPPFDPRDPREVQGVVLYPGTGNATIALGCLVADMNCADCPKGVIH